MAENFYAIFDVTATDGLAPESTYEKAKALEYKTTNVETYGRAVHDCCVLRLEAENVKEAQNAVKFWCSSSNSTPIIVKEAQWKET